MKKIFIIAAILISTQSVFAQEEEKVHVEKAPEEKGLKKENFFIGGNFGLAFGDYTLINIAPQLGYRFNKTLAAGIGLNMLYSSVKDRDIYGNNYSKTSQGIVGLNIFGRVYPFDFLMLQVQPEANYRFGNIRYYQPPGKYKLDAEIVPSLLAGGGVVVPSGRSALIISLMYDVLQDPDSPYGTRPVLNVGYNISLSR